ncbi:MAG: formyltetrahydrofolate deformylase [Gammaproteobacteria bacterium]
MYAPTTTARLLIQCPDQAGIVASVSNFFFNHGANITMLDQHSTDPEGGKFFLRLEFQTPHLDVSQDRLEQIFAQRVASLYSMTWHFSYAAKKKRMAIMVSRLDHAMLELLWRWQRQQLHCDVTQVISNHNNLAASVAEFDVPFHHVPVGHDSREAAEQKILDLLGSDTDVVVLARYMQILSNEFVAAFPNRIINIHHSFLPAFVGANPYVQAYDRGVKLIGATAHYVTNELDQGPIIEQAVKRVTHRDDAFSLKEKGRDVERAVLAQAVQWHLEDRVLVHDNKTVVFV